MEFSLITNDPVVARTADQAGVDRIFIDLERRGKADRQKGRQLFHSTHVPGDVGVMNRVLAQARLMVRIDPPHDGTREQVTEVIESGADFVMLPYFQHVWQAQNFIEFVDGRAATVLLVETAAAAENLPKLARLPGLSEIHIGLNDLSISLGREFLFELISDGTVPALCQILRDAGLPFGFGGIGSLARNDLPIAPEYILATQICEGATRGWLGRTFRSLPVEELPNAVSQLRSAISFWRHASLEDRRTMMSSLRTQISAVADAGKFRSRAA
ncbi:MAG: aldolase [Rhodopirellula sp.]|nr:aldolase [Rhodopirellula sp.]